MAMTFAEEREVVERTIDRVVDILILSFGADRVEDLQRGIADLDTHRQSGAEGDYQTIQDLLVTFEMRGVPGWDRPYPLPPPARRGTAEDE